MGALERQGDGTAVPLRVHHLFGRSSSCHTQLEEPEVSAVHASMRWSSGGWELRDLGSRNGTWVDGRRLQSGEGVTVTAGTTVAFGSPDSPWTLASDAAPLARAFPRDGGEAVVEEGGLLSLPSREDLELLVFRDEDGRWWAESDGGAWPATELREPEAGGRPWVLDLPELDPRTPMLSPAPGPVSQLALHFEVSSDEEHVQLSALSQGEPVDLGARSHHYLLLTLARRRLAHQQAEPGEAHSHGWIYVDELVDMLRTEETQLNVQVFRVRKQLAQAGIAQAQDIIERRRSTRQLRIGVADLRVTRC